MATVDFHWPTLFSIDAIVVSFCVQNSFQFHWSPMRYCSYSIILLHWLIPFINHEIKLQSHSHMNSYSAMVAFSSPLAIVPASLAQRSLISKEIQSHEQRRWQRQQYLYVLQQCLLERMTIRLKIQTEGECELVESRNHGIAEPRNTHFEVVWHHQVICI